MSAAATSLRDKTPGTTRPETGGTTGRAVPGRAARGSLATLRIVLGWSFLWPFLDKMFGLGFSTESAGAVVNGGSPTEGFLLHGTKGPFAHVFDSVAGAWWLDTLFMLGLLGIGLALLLGIGTRIAAVVIAATSAGRYFGLGKAWQNLPLVQRPPGSADPVHLMTAP
ncbi:DoxX family membrane protein [Streptomyces sp. NPDC058872]|uniref:DoxX family membrane protein n=1 Tax=Streptomyces sp. NPDC058872 TaxID=3346661 RepID=UPI00367E5DFF